MIKNILGIPKRLPFDNLMDSVHTANHIQRCGPIERLLCDHPIIRPYTRTDFRPGPGWMSDSYQGLVCTTCGSIHSETKVY